MTVTHASLFSGIGGAELAASWMGWENAFHCEVNPFGLQVLRYWFPESREYNDITKTDFTEWRGRIDVLTGGFPCQPFSTAGRRKGAGDDRYLWPEMCRVIDEVQPRYVVGENVAGILSMVEPVAEFKVGERPSLFGEADDICQRRERYTVERVLGDLAERGYAVQVLIIPALAVGAPHRRDRVWVLARRDSDPDLMQRRPPLGGGRGDGGRQHTPREGGRDPVHAGPGGLGAPRRAADASGLGRGLGDAAGLRGQGWRPGEVGERHDGGPGGGGAARPAPDAAGVEQQGREREERPALPGHEPRVPPARPIPRPGFEKFPTQPPLCGGDDGLSVGLADTPLFGGRRTRWIAESVRALGNAWVPQVAYELFRAIGADMDGGRDD